MSCPHGFKEGECVTCNMIERIGQLAEDRNMLEAQNSIMRSALEKIAYGTLSLDSEAWMLATETLTRCNKI